MARLRGQDAPPSVERSGYWVVPTSAKKLGVFAAGVSADGATLRSALMDDQPCDPRRTSTRAPTKTTRHARPVVGRRLALGSSCWMLVLEVGPRNHLGVGVRARVADEAVVKRCLGSARKIVDCYFQVAGEVGGC